MRTRRAIRLGRQVRKGERGIVILAPALCRTDADEVDLPHGEEAAGSEPAQRQLVGVKPTHVCDVTQTDGDPIPAPPTPQLLTGTVTPGLWDALAAQVTAAGFRLESGTDLGGANGRTDFGARSVVVRSDVADAQAVKTLAHDLLTAPSVWSTRGPRCGAQSTRR